MFLRHGCLLLPECEEAIDASKTESRVSDSYSIAFGVDLPAYIKKSVRMWCPRRCLCENVGIELKSELNGYKK